MLRRIIRNLKIAGVAGLSDAVLRRVIARPIASFSGCRPFIVGKSGLEIGGPSAVFARRGLLPIYSLAGHIDNCNFSAETLWEGALQGGATFEYDKDRPRGNQYFLEATELTPLASNSYDFVLSSHVLEHVANPLRALSEWVRVLRPDGVLVLIVPHKEGTFDHRRPITTLQHLIADFESGTSETDTTHVAEILELHDLSRDPEVVDRDAFENRTLRNVENRGLHHHVFDTEFAVRVIDHTGLRILATEVVRPFHIVVIAQKTKQGQQFKNEIFIGQQAAHRHRSPFKIDRHSG